MKQTIDKYLGYFLAFLMMVMTLDVLWGVITRYVVGSQASWSEELARFLLIWIGFLGGAYVSGKRMHLSIDLLKPSLSDAGKDRLQLIISLLIVVFVLLVMVVGGLRLMYITQVLKQLSAALRVPMALVYSVVPISGLLIMYYKLIDLKQKQPV